MKTNRITPVSRTSKLAMLAVTIITLTFVNVANAQYKTVEDGIAASPRVRQMLNELKASSSTAAAKAQPAAKCCPKCTNVRTTVPNREAKGAEILAGATTKVVNRHGCKVCETKLTVRGEGKNKHTVATHKCAC